jgi:hypothetical protein
MFPKCLPVTIWGRFDRHCRVHPASQDCVVGIHTTPIRETGGRSTKSFERWKEGRCLFPLRPAIPDHVAYAPIHQI